MRAVAVLVLCSIVGAGAISLRAREGARLLNVSTGAETKAVAAMKQAAEWMQSHIPEARQCGATMNIAWRESKQHPCTELMHAAADAMGARVEMCSKLRNGADYVTSYGELLRTNERWCGGPYCPAACGTQEVCQRAWEYPFAPRCVRCSLSEAHTGPACDNPSCTPACDRFQKTFKLVNTTGATNASASLASGRVAGAAAQGAESNSEWMQSHVPEERQCGATMTIAWRENKDKKCGEEAHAAAAAMGARVEMCRKLPGKGEAYVTSYGELLRTTDKWCGGPFCKEACPRKQVCFRDRQYPFAPTCTRCSDEAHTGPACSAPDANCLPACDRFKDAKFGK